MRDVGGQDSMCGSSTETTSSSSGTTLSVTQSAVTLSPAPPSTSPATISPSLVGCGVKHHFQRLVTLLVLGQVRLPPGRTAGHKALASKAPKAHAAAENTGTFVAVNVRHKVEKNEIIEERCIGLGGGREEGGHSLQWAYIALRDNTIDVLVVPICRYSVPACSQRIAAKRPCIYANNGPGTIRMPTLTMKVLKSYLKCAKTRETS